MLNISKIESTINSKSISVAELARILGEPYTTIVSRKKKGTWTPDDVEKIADFFGKSILYFFDREEEAPKLPGAEHVNITNKVSEPSVEVYSCPECRPRVKKIQEQKQEIERLKDELLECYRMNKKENSTANSA